MFSPHSALLPEGRRTATTACCCSLVRVPGCRGGPSLVAVLGTALVGVPTVALCREGCLTMSECADHPSAVWDRRSCPV